ncbi:MAG: efflux transporter periplasmic adaptor subunit [Flavobacteriales bacterium]|jgi:RND family efflux transporter MFP subunit|nr:efflux transporter periplasmic adaptor subunit [Flavobacteriales bacterium]|tara:strand:- start:408497 stop:409660 length:1164 start_codon:yes stop_codon:yes gene_type:complete
MKKILIIISVAVTLISCGGKEKTVDEIVAGKNLEEINAKKNELTAKQNAILDEIEKLDIAIANLDSSLSIPVITTIEATTTSFKHYVQIQGNVQTKENIIIYPEYAGVLTKVLVKEGQFVTKGEVLAKIDDGGLNQQLSQMETQLALAKTTFERQERLWKDKIGSEIQFLQAKANYEAQQKAVNQMKEQLAKTTITAPFSGVIDDVMSEQGQVVSPGMNQLFRIINLKDMFIEAEIPENYITNIKTGSQVNVYFPVLNDTVTSTIRQVSNYINPNNRTFKIEIAITNENKMVKPNMTALLSINNYINDSALVLPQAIISENAEGEKYVYVVKKGKKNRNYAEKRLIKIGKIQNGVAEIIGGIANGDIIIDEGARTVKEQEQVLIKKM